MQNRELTPTQRLAALAAVVVGIFGVAICAYVLVADQETNLAFKVLIGLLGLVALTVTIVRGVVFATGKVDMRLHPKITAYVSFYGILLFVVGVFLVTASVPDGAARNYIILVALFPLLLATAKLILWQMHQSELNMQEKLLRIEIQLAELAEQLPNKQ